MFLLRVEEIIFQVECHFNCVGWPNFQVPVNKINYNNKEPILFKRYNSPEVLATQNRLKKIKETATKFHCSKVVVALYQPK